MVRPSFFLRTPDMTPRTEWRCQPVALTISSRLAPLAWRSSSTSLACLLPGRMADDGRAFSARILRVGELRAVCRRPLKEDAFPILVFMARLALVSTRARAVFGLAPITRRPAGVIVRATG